MIKGVLKRATALLLALSIIISLLPELTLPVMADTVDVSTHGIAGLEVEYDSAYTSVQGNTVTASRASEGSRWEGCFPKTTTIKFINKKDSAAVLSFSFTLTNAGSLEVGSTKYTSSQSATTVNVDRGGSITFTLTSNSENQDPTTAVITIIGLEETSETRTVTVATNDASLGTVTGGGTYKYQSTATITATPVGAGKFLGWYDSSNTLVSSSQTYSFQVNDNVTYTARFISSEHEAYIPSIQTSYPTLKEALAQAEAIGGGLVFLLRDVTMTESLTVPTGVTLLVPCQEGDTGIGTANIVYQNASGNTKTEILFRTLTIPAGVTLTVNGKVEINAVIGWNNSHSPQQINGNYGKIDLAGQIIVKSGGELQCLGRVSGSGTVTVESGGTAVDLFVVEHWRGGSFSSKAAHLSGQNAQADSVMPLFSYRINNISTRLEVQSGGILAAVAQIVASDKYNINRVTVIGPSGLLQSDGTVIRTHDETSDEAKATVSGYIDKYIFAGNSALNSITLKIESMTMNTAGFAFGIPHGFHMELTGNYTYTINNKFKFLYGSKMTVKDSATLVVDGELAMYDGVLLKSKELAALTAAESIMAFQPTNGTQAPYDNYSYSSDTVNQHRYWDYEKGMEYEDTYLVLQDDAKLKVNGKFGGVIRVLDRSNVTVNGTPSVTNYETTLHVYNSFLDNSVAREQYTFNLVYYYADYAKVFDALEVYEALGELNGNFTDASVATLEAAVAAANASIANPLLNLDGNQAVVEKLAQDILDAIAGLTLEVTLKYQNGAADGKITEVYGTEQKYANLPTPTRDGYTFSGWYTAAEGGTKVENGSTFAVNGHHTLYAQWTAKSNVAYTVEHWQMNVDGNGYTQFETETRYDGTTGADTDFSTVAKTYEGFTLDSDKTENVSVEADGSAVLKIYYTRNQYDLTWDYEDNVTPDKVVQDIYYGEEIAKPETNPTRVGYTFSHWFIGNDSSVVTSFPTTMTAGDLTIRAAWEPKTYNVNYHLNYDGAGVYTTGNAEYEQPYTLPENNPTRYGYTFAGWYTDAACSDGNKIEASTTHTTDGDITLYAKWELGTYTITFVLDNGQDNIVVTGKYGEAFDVPEDPEKIGHTFAEWDKEIPATMPGENIQIKAKWTVNSYTVTWDNQGATTTETYQYGAVINAHDAPNNVPRGYRFVEWEGFTANMTMPAENLTFTAKFEIGRFAITLVLGNGQENIVIEQEYNTAVAAQADPTRTGYTFAGWRNENGLDEALPTVMGAEDRTFTAKWEPSANQYSVEYYEMDTSGNYGEPWKTETITENVKTEDQVSVAPVAGTGFEVDMVHSVLSDTVAADGSTVLKAYMKRQQFTVTWDVDGVKTVDTYYYGAAVSGREDPTREGHTFVGWDKDIPTTMPSENIQLKAKWTVNSYTVTWNVDGVKTEKTYVYNQVIPQFTSPTKFGYTFSGWDGYTSGMTMPARDVEFTATWTKNQYTITFNANGGAEAAYTQVFTYGDTVNLVANTFTRVGYHFLGWSTTTDSTVEYANGAAIEDELVQLENSDKKIALYAVWGINTYTVTYDTNGGSGTTDAQNFDHNGYVFAHDIPVKPGYTFSGWKGNNGKLYEAGVQIISNDMVNRTDGEILTLTAQWTANVYQVFFVIGYAGGETPAAQNVTFNEDYGVLPAPTRVGYNFVGWYTDNTYTEQVTKDTTYTTLGNTTLYAKWEPAANQYTVEYYEMDTNGNYGTPWKTEIITQNIKTGDSVSVSYEAGIGFVLDTDKSVLSGTVAANGSTVLKVYMKRQQHTVTWDVEGNKTVETYYYGTVVSKKAAPAKTGYTFAGWSGYSDSMTMPAENVTFTATWTINQYIITLVLGNGQENIVIKQDYNSGIAEQADPSRTGYTFAGWSEQIPATMPAKDMEITATWSANDDTAYKVEHWQVNVDGNGYTLFETENKTGTTATQVTPGVKTYVGFTAPAVQTVTIAADGSLVVRYEYIRNQYNVTWNVDGDEETVMYYYGATIVKHENPTKTGYNFVKWSGYADAMTMPAADQTFTAVWSAKSYDVVFEANGGTVDPVSKGVTFDETYGALPTPVRAGYVFTGWYTAGEGGAQVTKDTIVQNEATHTLYAHWTPGTTSYTIVHMQQDVADDEYTEAERQTLNGVQTEGTTAASALVYPGFTAQEIQQQTIAGDGSTVVYVYYNRNVYALSWNVNNGILSGDYTSGQIRFGTPITAPAVTRNGYAFVNWGAEVEETMPANDLNYTVQWQVIPYSITYVGVEGATNTNPAGYNVETETFTLAEPTKTGYTFLGWTWDGQDEPVKEVTVAQGSISDRSYTANWQINRYTVTWDVDGVKNTVSYYYGAVINKPANPIKPGYTFAGWSPAVPGTMGAADAEFTATWSANDDTAYKVEHWQMNVDGNGYTLFETEHKTGTTATEVTPGVKDYVGFTAPATQTVTIAADGSLVVRYEYIRNQYSVTFYDEAGSPAYMYTAYYGAEIEPFFPFSKNGYEQAGWKDGNGNEITFPMIMPAYDSDAVAQWEAVEYSVNYDLDGGSVTGNPGTYTIESDSFTLIQPTKTGYIFLGWTWDGQDEPVKEVTVAQGSTGDRSYTANWQINRYTITLVLGNGQENIVIEQNYNSAIAAQAAPVRTGYTFAGWDVEIPAIMPAENLIINATWTPVHYTVTFHPNGAAGSSYKQIFYYDQANTLVPRRFDRAGYAFMGWADGDGNVYDDKAPVFNWINVLNGNIDLYAQWDANAFNYTVEYYLQNVDGNGYTKDESRTGTYVADMDSQTAVDAAQAGAIEGFTFDHADNITISAGEDNVVKVYYTRNQYEVTWDVDGVKNIVSYYYGAVINKPANPIKPGYTFAGWGAAVPAVMPVGNLELTAQWEIITYNITYVLNGGSVTGNPGIYTIERENFTLIQPTKTGYTFLGWTWDGQDEPVKEVTVVQGSTGDRSYTANWKANQYTIHFNANGSEGTMDSLKNVAYTEFVILTNGFTRAGYTFAGWATEPDGSKIYENGASVSGLRTEDGSAITIYALWTANNYTVSFGTGTGGTFSESAEDAVQDQEQTYDQSSVTLPDADAVTKTGYTYTQWTDGETNYDAGTTIDINLAESGTVTLTPAWVPNSYTVVFNANGGTGEMEDQTFTYDQAQNLSENILTRTGYTFAGWTTMAPCDSIMLAMLDENYANGQSVNNLTAENNGTVTLYALWTANTYQVSFDADGGSACSGISVIFDGTYGSLPVSTKTGYTFSGWYLGNTKVDAATVVTTAEDHVLMAKWTVNQYTITLVLGNGQEDIVIKQDYNSVIATHADPTRTGYTFAGWNVELPERMPAENAVITAKWTANSYNVAFQANSGTVDPISKVVTFDKTYGVLPTPVRAGYIFAGWYTAVEGGVQVTMDTIVQNEAAHTLYAHWTPGTTSYTIIHMQQNVADDRYTESYRRTVTNAQTEDTTVASALVYPGFTAQEIQQQPIAGDGSTVVYVYYNRNVYTLSWNANNGILSGDYTSGQIRFGTPITAPVVTKNGYSFVNWGAEVVGMMPAEDLSYSAQWEVIPYTITYGGVEGAANTNPAGYNVETETITLAEPTKTGYTFLGWTWDGQEEPVKTVTIETGSRGNRTYTANWQINQYTITLVLGNGQENIVIEQNYNTAIDAQADPTRTGYTFAGWDAEIPETMPAENLIINATWQVRRYTITFQTMGGTPVASINQDYGTAVTAPADPVRTGYTFAGWDQPVPLTMPAQNITLTASWTANVYSVIFHANGGTGTMENQSMTWDGETEALKTNTFTRKGYTFLGWALTENATTAVYSDGGEVSNLVSQGAISLYAVWKLDTYEIRYALAGGTVATANPISYTVEQDSFTLNNPTKVGYTFLGWTWNGQTEPVVQVTVEKGSAGNREYTANWKANKYTVAFYANGGTGEQMTQILTWDHGAEELMANTYTRKGYSFLGWALTADATTVRYEDGDEVTNLVSQGEIALYAVWERNTYTINYTLNGGRVETENPVSYHVDNDSFTLNNPVKTGYTFIGWTVNGGTEKMLNMTVEKGTAGNLQFEAHWQINTYTITFHTNGGDSVEVLSREYLERVLSADVAKPNRVGHTFAGWYLDAELTRPVIYPVTMTENLEFYAKWTVNSYTITFADTGETVIAPITQYYGTTVTAPGDPTKVGYTFAGWSPAVPTTMPGENITLIAQWTVNQYTITFANTGDSVIAPMTQDYGSAVTAPADPVRKGYTFAGWDVTVPTTMPAENLVITAKWTINQYRVIFDVAGGVAIDPIIQDYMTQVDALPNATRAGYRFDGWFYADGSAVTLPITLEGDVTVVAHWTSYLELLMAIHPADFVNAEDGGTDREVLEQARAYFNLMKMDGEQLTKYQGSEEPYASHWDALEAEIREVTLLELEDSIERQETLDRVNDHLVLDGKVVATLNVDAQTNYVEIWIEDPNRKAGDLLTAPFLTTLLNDRNIWSIHFPAIEGETDDGVLLTPYGTGVDTLDQFNLMVRVAFVTINIPEITGEPDRLSYSEFYIWLQHNREIAIGVLDSRDLTIVINAKTPEGVEFSTTYVLSFCNRTHNAVWNVDGETTAVPYDYEEVIVKPADPVKEGYTFTGWSGYTDSMTMGKETLIFQATWQINSYDVTWNIDGETTTETYEYGQTIVKPVDPVKEGHTFIGWSGYTEGMGMPARDMTFTAVWDVQEFNVTFNSDGGTPVETVTQEYGTQIAEPAIPEKTGYTFAGWYNGDTKVEFPLTMPAGGLNLKANWTINQYTIMIVLGNGMENITITQNYNTVVAEPAEPTREGYTFAGWDQEIPAYMPAENMTITALWSVNEYTVTFILGNGQDDIIQTLNYGDTIVVPEIPEKMGHSFTGWSGYTDGMTVPAGNVTITAQWTPNQYTVTLDADGGTVDTERLTVTYGQPYGLPTPVRDGYTFDGWFYNGALVSANVDITADATFVAQWTLGTPYNISYDLAGGSWSEGTSPRVQYTVETDSFTLPRPVREGYTFAGWTGTELAQPTKEVTVTKGSTGDRSYTATWTINSYDVTWNVDGVETVVTYQYGAVIELPTTPAKEGHTFAGWTGYADGMTMSAGNVTFTAVWTVNQYTITFIQGNGQPDIVKTQNYGTMVTAPADPSREGYTFGGWDKTVPGTMPAENLVITAKWTINRYTITFVQGDGQPDIVLNQDYGTAVSVPSDPTHEGHTFTGWDQLIPGTMPAENLVITAKWSINRYIITFVQGNGQPDIVLNQDYGTAVSAPADPTREGYTFLGWSAEIPGTMPAGNMIISALWEINVYAITFDTAGGSAVEAIQDIFGAPITVPADPTREGYTFAGWDVEIPDTMPAGDMSITAKWTVNTYTLTYLVDGEVYKTFRLNYGAVVIIEQEPAKTGYTFSGWDQTAMLMPAHDVQISGTFAPNTYTVHFNANYPAAPTVEDMTVTFDSAYGILPVVSRTGYTFQGWILDGELVTAETLVKTAGEHTLIAKWAPNTYKVNLVLDGGECDVTQITMTYDGTYAELPVPTRDGYDFLGWFDGENQVLNSAKVNITADQILTARWKASGNTPYIVEHYQKGMDGQYVLVLTENLTGAADTLTQAQQQSYTGFHVNASLSTANGVILPDGSLVLKLYYDRDSYDVVWNVAGRQIREIYLYGQPLQVADPAWEEDIHARYDFTGWDQELPETVFTSATYTAQYSLYYEATIGPVTYRTLPLALANAKPGETVRLARDVTISEDLTVPADVLLLIPCKEDDNGYDKKYEGKLNFNYDAPNASGVATLYRTLTVAEGVTLTIRGAVLLNSVSGRTSTGEQDITGGYAQMILNGETVVANGGLLDCFGFITGSGKVTVLNGGAASDMYIVRHWRGGTQAYNMYLEDIYPMNEYDCRNIEVDVVIHYGGSYEGLVKMYAGNEYNYTRYPQVHISNGLIRLNSEEGYVVRSLVDGREVYQVYGGGEIASSALTILGVDLTTADFLYPIDGDIWFELYGGRYDIVNDYKFLPGSSVLVGSDASLFVATGVTVVFYQEFNDVPNVTGTQYPAGRAPAVLTIQAGGSFTNAGIFAGHIYTESPNIWIGAGPVWEAVTKEANGQAATLPNGVLKYVELTHDLSIERPGHTWHYGDDLSIVWDGYADYSAVQQAIASIPKDLGYYTPESVAAIQPAVDAVIYNLPYEKQAEVDAMAIPIQKAVAGLICRTVTVTLDPNGGTVKTTTLEVTCTMAFGTLPNPTREFHSFQGWYDADGNRVTAKTIVWYKDDLTLTAKWQLKNADYTKVVRARRQIPADMSMYSEASVVAVNAASAAVVNGLTADRQAEVDAMAQTILDAIDNLAYTVTLDANGGSVEPQTIEKIRKETDYAGLPTPIRPGYRFDGWFNGEGIQITAESVPNQGHHTLTAQWTLLPADYSAVDAALALVPEDLTIYSDETEATLQAAISGVVRDLMGDRQEEVDAMAHAILDAIADLKPYTIQIAFNANGGTVDVTTKTVEYTKAYGELPVPEYPGHRFDGWFNADGEQVTAETIADTKENVTLTAKWTVIPADYSAVDAVLALVPADLTIYSDETAAAVRTAVNAVIRDLLVNHQDEVDAMAQAIEAALAALELRTITVTLDANGGTVNPSSITVTCSKTFGELPVPVYPGYGFAGWYAAEGIRVEADTIVEARADMTLIAHWVENMADYTVVENAKAQIPADLSGYSDETLAALNAALAAVDYTLTADRQAEVDAIARAILDAIAGLKLYQVQVTFDANGGAVNVASMMVEYTKTYGELPVPVRPGYTFGGWFDAEDVQVTAETIVAAKADVTLTARWTGIPADYTAVEDAKAQIPTDLSIYTDESVAALNAALAVVDYTLTADRQAEVDAMAQAILDAIATLEKQTVIVTTDDGNGNVESVEVALGEPIGKLPTPEDDCKLFLGWYNAEGELVTENTIIDSLTDMELTAKWQDVCLEEPGEDYTIVVHYHGEDGVISYVDVIVDPSITVDEMTLRIPVTLPTTREASQAPLIHLVIPDGFKLRLEIPTDTLHYGNVVMKDIGDGSLVLKKESVIWDYGLSLLVTASEDLRVVENSISFPDVTDGFWAKDSIDYMSARRYLIGKTNGTYGVEEKMDRKMVVLVLWRLAGMPVHSQPESPFPDVTNPDSNYYDAIMWAYEKGITTGHGDGTFRPDKPITREQFAALMHRYAMQIESNLATAENGTITDFKDYGKIDPKMYENIQWAMDTGLMNGHTDGTFEPDGETPRYQMSVVFFRFLQAYCKSLGN